MVKAIEGRGGRVLFADFPTAGLVRAIEEKRYPRELFWDRFVGTVKAKAIDAADYPSLDGFQCPDGSHLDFRDRSRFTLALFEELGLGRAGRAAP